MYRPNVKSVGCYTRSWDNSDCTFGLGLRTFLKPFSCRARSGPAGGVHSALLDPLAALWRGKEGGRKGWGGKRRGVERTGDRKRNGREEGKGKEKERGKGEGKEERVKAEGRKWSPHPFRMSSMRLWPCKINIWANPSSLDCYIGLLCLNLLPHSESMIL